ncbi:hypothetical protein L3556_10375 [Candidatus Synechococcus calcipolaris G9]|uniref:Uncharacterized protein n=1 Tax=Candidatus Synechococcus calcipolaris G9 TaxID=1497997 RepID=A0ABT6F0E1_9SYNE|nr:hypothetical protein [Candidatus Synechococcus calcipolaris]MDG2991331.1 hypothetical protein [Candidatus Synechococcus calcipolaris G9]
MALDAAVMTAVEQLGYRVTVGDVAARAGMNVRQAEQELLALASDVGGTLQVAETGDIAYVLPQDFRGILRAKYLRLRLQEAWQEIWNVVFYIIRASFGIFLVVSIVLIFLAIAAILIAMTTQGGRGNDRGGGGRSGGGGFNVFFFPDFWYFFGGGRRRSYGAQGQRDRGQRGNRNPEKSENDLNFLEGIYSFLFGDGNPNENLEEERWQIIGQAIVKFQGAVTAEQLAPYLDLPNDPNGDEDFMIPVLSRFNGQPQVTDSGDIIYHFPELQVTARKKRKNAVSIPTILEEKQWKFSQASSGQVMAAIALGTVNFIGALMLWSLLGDGTIAAELGGLVAFVQSIFWLLLAYGIGFLGIPLGRYYWLLGVNSRIRDRNTQRQRHAIVLERPSPTLVQKLAAAKQYAGENYVSESDLAYTSEKDLIEQELESSDKIDAEWIKRLEGNS